MVRVCERERRTRSKITCWGTLAAKQGLKQYYETDLRNPKRENMQLWPSGPDNREIKTLFCDWGKRFCLGVVGPIEEVGNNHLNMVLADNTNNWRHSTPFFFFDEWRHSTPCADRKWPFFSFLGLCVPIIRVRKIIATCTGLSCIHAPYLNPLLLILPLTILNFRCYIIVPP